MREEQNKIGEEREVMNLNLMNFRQKFQENLKRISSESQANLKTDGSLLLQKSVSSRIASLLPRTLARCALSLINLKAAISRVSSDLLSELRKADCFTVISNGAFESLKV